MHYAHSAPRGYKNTQCAVREMHDILDAAAIESVVDVLCTCADFRLGYWLLMRVFGVPEYMLIY